MNYSQILKKLKAYGMSKEDIIKRAGYEEVLENVVIAPWWDHDIFAKFSKKIEKCGERVYNVYLNNLSFSFIEIKNIGASKILDDVLSLGVTKCKNLIFIGSVGAIDKDINIGDVVIPEYSFCGVGVERYLNDNLDDNFETKNYPNKALTLKTLKVAKKYEKQARVLLLPNYSVDCIFAQFPHIDHIISLGAKTLELETSTVFKCAEVAKIKATALLCVSDNSVNKRSLYSGRSLEDKKQRSFVKTEIIPKIIIDVFSK